MFDRKMKEYPNYLSQIIKNEDQLTKQIYNACEKALSLNDFIFLNEENRKGVIIPSVIEGQYILIANFKDKLHVAYEKTDILKKSQPFKLETRKLLQGENVLYGMHNLFKFNEKSISGMQVVLEALDSGNISNEIITAQSKGNNEVSKLNRTRGDCLGAMTDIGTLKVLGDSLSALKLMSPISDKVLENIGKQASQLLTDDSDQFISDLDTLYNFCKENKYTVKQPFEYNAGNNRIWNTPLANTVCFSTTNIGYLAKKDNENNWTIYPYSKEYCLNSSLKEITNKIKNNTINDIIDANLKIENKQITHLSGLLYDMAIDLFCATKEIYQVTEEKNRMNNSKNKMK